MNNKSLKFIPVWHSFGRVHAYLLDDGDELTLINALLDAKATSILNASKSLGRQSRSMSVILRYT